jgi:hypothetical protein
LQGQNKERWEELCRQAATEQNPEKLLLLIREINDILDAKEKRLIEARAKSPMKPDTA